MKKFILKLSSVAVFAVIISAACKKQETQIYTKGGGTAPVLTASLANNDSIPLIPADSLNAGISFSWTNPNYVFSDGISSQNVTYYIEVDTAGANFSSPNMQQVSISSSLDTTFTVGQFNTILGNGLQLVLGQSHNIQVRIESFITPNTSGSPLALPLYSNVYTYKVTPYAPPPKIAPPSSGTLFIVGSATPEGWLSGTTAQQFTQISSTEYRDTIPLPGNGEYKFIGNNNNYNLQYSVATNDDPAEVNGGPFISGSGNNILAPATSGTYIIDVNFQTGRFTVTLR
jgi:hypothetical protein